MEKTLICIGCPIGCTLTATDDNGNILISGNICKIGKEYGINEMTNPRRTLTANVKISGADIPVLSVKTKTDIPKSIINDCVSVLNTITVKAPVAIGDIILENICKSGVDVVATKSL